MAEDTLKNQAEEALNGVPAAAEIPNLTTTKPQTAQFGSVGAKPKVMTKPKPKAEEMVSVPKGLLEQLLNDVQDLKHGRTNAIVTKRVQTHTATVRVLDDKYLVVGIKKVWVENQGKPEERSMCQVEYQVKDEVKSRAMPYLEFLNDTPTAQCTIQKQRAIEKPIVRGMKAKTNPDPVKFSDDGTTFTPGMVEDMVLNVEYESEIIVNSGALSGESFTINNNWLNI